ncbi:hypothetical protein CPB83DRAFT_428638 [Crepidotus variabilis]|uniref:Uncharacterized protein n=1 Tax=Crepidotus variabilis TaxID=179855 RepID=A0A9P6EDX9_9AGAR|nr:hypothetical protein CPB83DRAFT_428638 [Crepidotus variabilis]
MKNGKPFARPFANRPNPSEIIDVDEYEEVPGLNTTNTLKDHIPTSSTSTLPTPPPSAPLSNYSHSDSNGFKTFNPHRSVPSGPADHAPRAADHEMRGSFSASHPPTGPAAYSTRKIISRPRSAEPNRRRSRSPPRMSMVASEMRSSRFGPPTSHSPDARRLMRESFDLKREIQALVAKHTTVTKQLQSLDNSFVPEPLQLDSDAVTTNGTGRVSWDLARDNRLIDRMKVQIEDLERDLKNEKTGRAEDWKVVESERNLKQEVGEQLEEERRLREEAEKAIADVRRECMHPFVVPSLLDAFVQVSKLTTRGLKVSPTPTPLRPSSNFDSNQKQSAVANDTNSLPVKAGTSNPGPSPSRFGNGPTTGYSRPSSTYQGHAPRNSSYSDRGRDQERERGRSRDRRPYNANDNRMESSSSTRYAMPPPRVPSPPRSFNQGKNGYRNHSQAYADAYNLSRRTIVKTEPLDDISML